MRQRHKNNSFIQYLMSYSIPLGTLFPLMITAYRVLSKVKSILIEFRIFCFNNFLR